MSKSAQTFAIDISSQRHLQSPNIHVTQVNKSGRLTFTTIGMKFTDYTQARETIHGLNSQEIMINSHSVLRTTFCHDFNNTTYIAQIVHM